MATPKPLLGRVANPRFAYDALLFKGQFSQDAYPSRTISKELAATPRRQGNIESLIRLVLNEETGDWFYAGWIDQAGLHIGKICSGDTRHFGTMLAQIDLDQVDQSGDMLGGFVRPTGSILTIEVCPDDYDFEIHLRTDREKEATDARQLMSEGDLSRPNGSALLADPV